MTEKPKPFKIPRDKWPDAPVIRFIRFVKKQFGTAVKHKSLVDICMMRGANLRLASKEGFKTLTAVSRATEPPFCYNPDKVLNKAKVEFFQEDGGDNSWATKQYDVILCHDHLDRQTLQMWRPKLVHILKMVKMGGYLFLSVLGEAPVELMKGGNYGDGYEERAMVLVGHFPDALDYEEPRLGWTKAGAENIHLLAEQSGFETIYREHETREIWRKESDLVKYDRKWSRWYFWFRKK